MKIGEEVVLQHLEGEFDDLLDGSRGLVLEDCLDGLGHRSWWKSEHLEGFAGLVVDFIVLEGRSCVVA